MDWSLLFQLSNYPIFDPSLFLGLGEDPNWGLGMKLAVFLKLAFPETEPTIISW
jgi:hypothetical protein